MCGIILPLIQYISNLNNYAVVLNFFKTYGASMCSKGKITKKKKKKKKKKAKNSRLRSRHAVNNLHNLRNTLQVEDKNGGHTRY